MRVDTKVGPVWNFPDSLGSKVAAQVVANELMVPREGFDVAHTGPSPGGALMVRAPRAALEAAGFLTGSAAEEPVAEGTVWPPLSAAHLARKEQSHG